MRQSFSQYSLAPKKLYDASRVTFGKNAHFKFFTPKQFLSQKIAKNSQK
jgi:hypothetical protein